MRHRLIHPQGNFGSIAGLPPAAMRYTEARLSAVAAEMLADLDRDTVDFIDNYDGKYREPLVLPSKFPNLLVNGSDGIAVGMATEIPPHNLARSLRRPHPAHRRSRRQHRSSSWSSCRGPDFPTGGIICGRQGILDGYRTGRGKVTLRARAEIDEEGNRRRSSSTKCPTSRRATAWPEIIGELVKDERIKGISDVRDEISPAPASRCASSSTSSATPTRNWSSTSSTSSRRCKRRSASSCWPWWTAGRVR